MKLRVVYLDWDTSEIKELETIFLTETRDKESVLILGKDEKGKLTHKSIKYDDIENIVIVRR